MVDVQRVQEFEFFKAVVAAMPECPDAVAQMYGDTPGSPGHFEVPTGAESRIRATFAHHYVDDVKTDAVHVWPDETGWHDVVVHGATVENVVAVVRKMMADPARPAQP